MKHNSEATAFTVFLISSKDEQNRKPFIELLKSQFPDLHNVNAIYPSKTRVPFLEQLKEKSGQRTGKRLNEGEIGLILTSRVIWRKILEIAHSDEEHFLILESDSKLLDLHMLKDYFTRCTNQYDIFFWGAWFGHLRLLRSKRTRLFGSYFLGEPLINSVACTYGYSINRKAASCLLKDTSKIHYPVDEFKKYIHSGALRFGAIDPELISTHPASSTIREEGMSVKEKLWIFILDCRNYILSRLK